MRVFVVEGYLQHGGTYMAYHLGRICHEYFQLPVVIAGAQRPIAAYFTYPYDFPVISIDQMEKTIEKHDLLICNPSFYYYFFGLRMNAVKLSYVQHISTFHILDAFYDRYVFVSQFVKDFILEYYRLDGPVINAFIHTEIFRKGLPWDERKQNPMILLHKEASLPLLHKLESMFRDKYPNVPLTFDLYQSLKQSDFANALGVHKFFLTLSPVEGFGLPALEAMAAGCAVIGFDAWGGRDYFRHDINCMVAPYPKLETIVDYLYVLICDDEKARSLAATALVDARRFDQRAFDIEWLKVFESIIHG